MKIFGRGVVGVIGSGLVAVLAGPAAATPIQVGIGSFSGSATVIDFQSPLVLNKALITTQFAGQGITFSGGLYKQTSAAITVTIPGSGGAVATNFLNSCSGTSSCGDTLTIDLPSATLRVGFDVATNPPDDLFINVAAYSGNLLVSTGVLTINTSTPGMFVGIEDSMQGIDRLELTPMGGSNGAMILDNFRFEGTAVPEPSAALLFPVGLLVAASLIRRPRQLV